LTSVIVGYGKALEVQINALVKSAMVSASAPARRIKIESSTVILPDALPLTLRQLSFALGGETAFGDHLRQTLTDGGWLTADFAAILEGFAVEARNPAAHGECVSREIIFRWRDRLLGVGTESILTRLAKVQRKR
jgi:hypothetical protein